MIKIYEYKSCGTCQKAIKFLEGKKAAFERVPIVEQPPSRAELTRMLQFLKERGKSFKNLFNTSGVQYRELKIADKIKAGMTEDEAILLLSKNGKLIKRPFMLTAKSGTVGFDAKIWGDLV